MNRPAPLRLAPRTLLACIAVAVSLALPLVVRPTEARAQGSPCNQGRAPYPQGEPRSPQAVCMPELGRMPGLISKCSHGSENFGQTIIALGDLDNDSLADWCIVHGLCDTIGPNGRLPVETLIYHGVRGGLPAASSGERIGPSEIASVTSVLAAGDWDADGFRDLACGIKILGDTSGGNHVGFESARLVIFWGNPSGHFSLDDTTRLVNSLGDLWVAVSLAASVDFDHDGVDELLVKGGGSIVDGVGLATPNMFLYHGTRGKRWGRDLSRAAAWTWWNTPPTQTFTVIDQDCDGAPDVALNVGGRAGTGFISVLYGRSDRALPDTSEVETIDLYNPNGHYGLLTDLTGDGVPEIAVTSSGEEVVKIWAGRHGMRLKEQYGTGLDQPATPGWVSRPWFKLWLPARINSSWSSSGFDPVFDLGDATADGIPDLWVYNAPWMLCYASGIWMDSLVDAIVDIRPGPIYTGYAVLGDIDGSGHTAMAVGNAREVIYLRQGEDVPHDADQARYPPPGTETPCASTSGIVEPHATRRRPLSLLVAPNPAGDELRLSWSPTDDPRAPEISIADESGRVLLRTVLRPGEGGYVIPATDLPPGACFVTLRIGNETTTVPARRRN